MRSSSCCDANVGECYYEYDRQANPAAGSIADQRRRVLTCGVTVEGNVVCWGLNSKGEAGDRVGSYAEVTTGEDHTCALRKADGGVDCWGNDEYRKARRQPASVSSRSPRARTTPAASRSTATWRVGVATPGARRRITGPDRTAKSARAICSLVRSAEATARWTAGATTSTARSGRRRRACSAGGRRRGHACAISSDGQIACWGRNDHDQATPPMPGAPPPFAFEGFYPPVEPRPTLNIVKAGSSVPLKFSLGGDKGLGRSSPRASRPPCSSIAPALSRSATGQRRKRPAKQPELRRLERPYTLCLENRQSLGRHLPRSRAEAHRRHVAHGRLPVQVVDIKEENHDR